MFLHYDVTSASLTGTSDSGSFHMELSSSGLSADISQVRPSQVYSVR